MPREATRCRFTPASTARAGAPVGVEPAGPEAPDAESAPRPPVHVAAWRWRSPSAAISTAPSATSPTAPRRSGTSAADPLRADRPDRGALRPGVGVQVTGATPRSAGATSSCHRPPDRGHGSARPLHERHPRHPRPPLRAGPGRPLRRGVPRRHDAAAKGFRPSLTERDPLGVHRAARGLRIAVVFLTTVHAGTSARFRGSAGSSSTTPTSSDGLVSDPRRDGTGECAKRPGGNDGSRPDHLSRPPAAGPRLGRAIVGTRTATSGGLLTAERRLQRSFGPSLYERFLEEFRHVSFDRRDVRETAFRFLATSSGARTGREGSAYIAKKLWELRRGSSGAAEDRKDDLLHQNFMPAHDSSASGSTTARSW